MKSMTMNVARVAAVLAATGLVLGSFVLPARAQTVAELQAMIAQLNAQIAALAGTTTSASVTFTTDLTIGSTGAEVTALQNWLISKGHTISAGATGYFGEQTRAALAAYQAANGIAPAAGYFGPVTRAKVNASGSVVTPTTPTTPTTPSTSISGDEADVEVSVVAESSITKDAADQHAFTIEIEADRNGGDAIIERLDIQLTSGVQSYRAITAVALEVDGKVIASVDTDRRADWRGDSDIVRFSGLNVVVKSGETKEVEVILDVTDKATDITLGTVDYRWTDATGIIDTDTETANAVVSVDEVDGLEFRFTKNSKTPSDSSLDVSSNQNNVVLALTDVEVRKGVNGVLEQASTTIVFNGAETVADIKELASRFAIEIDGKQIDYVNASTILATSTGDYAVVIDFDLDEYEVEEGDKITVGVLANLRSVEDPAITSVKLTKLALFGYDEAADDSFYAENGVSHAALYTLTEGDITVDIDDSTVAVGEPLGQGTTGTIEFEVTVDNDSGSTLNVGTSTGNWKFDVKGYSGIAIESIVVESTDAGATTLADGAEETYKVTLTYTTKVSNQTFSIEVKEIGGLSIGYIWRD